jgi:hypothetical protein
MKCLAALLLPLVATAAILPDAIGPHKRTATSTPDLADRPIWDEYGLKAVENGVFEAEKTRFSVTIWRLQDPTGAMAAEQWVRSVKKKGPAYLQRVGNYLVSYDGYMPTEEEAKALESGLVNVDRSSLPVLPTYLPSSGLMPDSGRYVTGPAGLQKFMPSIAPSVAAFNYGTEAQIGIYRHPKGDLTLGIFNYPTHQMAMQQAPAFEKVPGAVVKRTGPMIAVVVAPPDPDFAQQVLSQIRYQAEITESEYVPTQRDNPGDLLYNLFLLIGMLLALAILSGLFVGVIRGARRRYAGTGQEDPMIRLRIEQ